MKLTPAHEFIKAFLEIHPTFAVMKPGCPYCQTAKMTLKNNNINFDEIDMETNPQLVESIKEAYNHKTFPMIFLDKNFVGGSDDLKKLYTKKKNLRQNL
jgi:glutaredoxin 3